MHKTWTLKLPRNLNVFHRWQLEAVRAFVEELRVTVDRESSIKHYNNLLQNVDATLSTKQDNVNFLEIALSISLRLKEKCHETLYDFHDNICTLMKALQLNTTFLETIEIPKIDQIVYECVLKTCEEKAWNIVRKKYNVDEIAIFYLWQFLLRNELPFCYIEVKTDE